MNLLFKNTGFKECKFNKETKEITLVEKTFERYEDGSSNQYETVRVFKPGDDTSSVPYGAFKSMVERLWKKE